MNQALNENGKYNFPCLAVSLCSILVSLLGIHIIHLLRVICLTSLTEWMCSSFLLLKKLFWYRKLSAQYNRKDFFLVVGAMTAAFVVRCNHSLLKKVLPLGWSMLCFATKGNTQAQRDQPLRNFYNAQRRCSISTEQPNTQFLASCKLKVERTKPFLPPHWDLKEAY